jgi:hypothetical protein
MGVTLFVHIEARARFDIGQAAGVGQVDIEALADPGANFFVGAMRSTQIG